MKTKKLSRILSSLGLTLGLTLSSCQVYQASKDFSELLDIYSQPTPPDSIYAQEDFFIPHPDFAQYSGNPQFERYIRIDIENPSITQRTRISQFNNFYSNLSDQEIENLERDLKIDYPWINPENLCDRDKIFLMSF
jgi:hypothetical protein